MHCAPQGDFLLVFSVQRRSAGPEVGRGVPIPPSLPLDSTHPATRRQGRAALDDGLRHPASASCLGRHSRLAGRCPNNCSLFPPLAAVAVVALRGGWSPEVGRGDSEHPSLPLAQRSVFARLRQADTFTRSAAANAAIHPQKKITERPQTFRYAEMYNDY